MEKQSKSKLLNVVKMSPFKSNVASYFTTDQVETEDECTQHSTRLSSVVQSCGYKLCDVAGDGNCCFTAIAFSLLILNKP